MNFNFQNENKIKYKNILNNVKNKIYDQPYIYNKLYYKSVIPLKIYQTWFTKNLSLKLSERVEAIKRDNPRFEHFLFDDNDCREFIKNNFR